LLPDRFPDLAADNHWRHASHANERAGHSRHRGEDHAGSAKGMRWLHTLFLLLTPAARAGLNDKAQLRYAFALQSFVKQVAALGYQPGAMAGSQVGVRVSFRVFGSRRYYSTTPSYRAPLHLSV
jgi:hypothetical protein